MSHAVKPCPECNSTCLTDNGGADSHTFNHSVHHTTHGIMHHNPIFLTVGLIGLAVRLLHPKKFTCGMCGHVFKA